MECKKTKYGEYKKLKLVLFEKNVNYESAAKIADLSVSAFSNKINGLVDFRIDEIAKLCNELDVNYSTILDEKLHNATS
jgi:predicted transcriptional regulator